MLRVLPGLPVGHNLLCPRRVPCNLSRFLIPLAHTRLISTRNMLLLPRDVREFLDNYPSLPDDPALNENLKFYSNQVRCRPDNLLIDELHEQ